MSAEVLAGTPPWNVFKLASEGGGLCPRLLHYRAFFEDPFPELEASYQVDLGSRTVAVRTYDAQQNPPILHRKELLLPREHPSRELFATLTNQLEKAGLLDETWKIGYREQWEQRLRERGYHVVGHELVCDDPEKAAVARSFAEVARYKTAIRRQALSGPMQALARHGYLDGARAVFDYGCGKGDDLRALEQNGIPAFGWDPHYHPSAEKSSAPIVNLGFVINVIENPAERAEVLQDAFSYAEELLVVGVMLGGGADEHWHPYGDGVVTRRGTFQKYYSQEELRHLITSALDAEPVPVGPGIFLVFRDPAEAQAFVERRSLSQASITHLVQGVPSPTHAEKARPFYEANQEVLDRLWWRYLSLGRRPRAGELRDLDEIEARCGTLRRALNFLERYHGNEPIAEAARARREDLRVFLAMEFFSRWPRARDYSEEMRKDLQTFFGSHAQAISEGRELLFSLADAEHLREACYWAAEQDLGAVLEGRALVLHSSQLAHLPAPLRAYIGCATQLYGDPTAADLIKVHIESGKLTLARYDDFEGKPLPLLIERVKLNFRTQDVDVFVYGEEYIPPYLYIKSRYIPEDFLNNNEAQRRFDAALLAMAGLDFSGFGPPRQRFDEALYQRRLQVDGFSLVPIQELPDLDDACGRYHTYRNFVECGETQRYTGLANVPQEPETYAALARLAHDVINPVMDYFGGIELTYGFCGTELARKVPERNDPGRDQHAGYERNRRGNRICARGGAAVDFLVPDESMTEVAQWIAEYTPFDRLYFYGDNRPLHVSVGPEEKREIISMRVSQDGRRIPRILASGSDLT